MQNWGTWFSLSTIYQFFLACASIALGHLFSFLGCVFLVWAPLLPVWQEERKEGRRKGKRETVTYFLWHLSMSSLFLIFIESFLRATIKSYTAVCLFKVSSSMPHPKFETGNLWTEFHQHTFYLGYSIF